MKALLVKKPWIDKILARRKTWELRGSSTAMRGCIALIESGSGLVVGTCEIVDVIGPLTLADLRQNVRKHGVTSGFQKLPYARTHAWVLKNARRLDEPVRYRHPHGAVIWVNLSRRTGALVSKLL